MAAPGQIPQEKRGGGRGDKDLSQASWGSPPATKLCVWGRTKLEQQQAEPRAALGLQSVGLSSTHSHREGSPRPLALQLTVSTSFYRLLS